MKRTLLSAAVLCSVLILAASFKRGSDCTGYFPLKQGVTTQMSSYTDKDKLTSTTKQTITSVTSSGDTTVVNYHSEGTDASGKSTNSNNFAVKCNGGVIYVDLSSMMDPKSSKFAANAKITGDFIDFPSNPSPGQQLKNGNITMTMTGQMNMSITTNITNRKVEALESKTCPAGTFDCVKISMDMETKVMMSDIKTHIVSWYGKNVGAVRTERYDDKGSLQGYSVLSSISGQ